MVDLDDDVEDLSIEELEQMVESLEAKKKLVAKQLKGKLAAAKAHAAKAERTKFWVPVDEDELYYYVSADGAVCEANWETDNDELRAALHHGNIFRKHEEAELAAVITRSVNFQIKFAFHAGGNGRQQVGSWLLGREGILKAKTLPYPTVIYMPNQESARACWQYLKNKKWLTVTD